MNNWKFLINRLILLFVMIGLFMGVTIGYSNFLIENLGIEIFISTIVIEMLGIISIYFSLLITTIEFIKDTREGKL